MMRYLITSDLHLNDNPRDGYRHDFMTETLPILLGKHVVNHLLILGDLTDEKDRHSSWLVNTIVSELHRLSRFCKVTILQGNHDYLDEANPFFQFTTYLNIDWINKPCVMTEQKMTFLPHTNDYKRDWHNVVFHKHVFTHNTFTGAKAEHGRELTGIPISVFPDNVTVISGDVHVPQKIGPVRYVGAPYTINFGDDYQPRVLLLNDNKLTSIPTNTPKKLLIDLDLTAGDFKLAAGKNDIVKVRAHISMNQMADWATTKNIIRTAGEALDCTVHSIHPIVEYESTKASKPKHRVRSDDELLNSYGRARGIDDKILAVGLKLMNST